jgi:hypothetical protein
MKTRILWLGLAIVILAVLYLLQGHGLIKF